MEELPAHLGDVLIMGENVINRREPGALERWCEYAERHDVLLYAGVLERNERSAIHGFRPEQLWSSEAIYERRFGLPGIPGGWGVGAGETRRISWYDRPIHWLICFEAFSPAAWIMSADFTWSHRGGRGQRSMDVGRFRWKSCGKRLAHSMARLWNSTAVFAATGRSVGVHENRPPPSPNQS